MERGRISPALDVEEALTPPCALGGWAVPSCPFGSSRRRSKLNAPPLPPRPRPRPRPLPPSPLPPPRAARPLALELEALTNMGRPWSSLPSLDSAACKQPSRGESSDAS
eukprot:scaffold1535_cov382-Prasinococcus_capsulatus_cf.AAC.38